MSKELDRLEKELLELSLEDRAKIYTRVYGIGTIGTEKLDDKFALISLVAFAHSRLKINHPNLTVLKFLLQITGIKKESNKHFYEGLENLSILIEDLTYTSTEFNTFGFTNSGDMINKIKEYLKSWTPF